MKVAIVHDYLKEFGGAERVVDALLEIWPKAPVFTTVFLPKFSGPHKSKVKKWDVRTTFLQYIPLKGKLLSPFRFIAPFVFKRMDLSDYDLVIVSAAGTYTSPNFIKKGRKTLHICYCHTPPRYLYGYPTANPWDEVMWRKVLKIVGQVPMHFLRMADYWSGQKPDYFVVNSKEVAGRVEKFYRRNSKVIYPPVDVDMAKVNHTKRSDYYLVGGRISRHKGHDLAVKACTKLGRPLKVFGGGFASYGISDLKKFAGENVEFLGEVTDEEKWKLMAGAKALLFPSEMEDFGITPVEAMAAGCPVIALGQGGVLETVIDGKTGVFFNERTVASLTSAIKKFEKMNIDTEVCRKQAAKFSKERFKREIKAFVQKKRKVEHA
jgi:glycosyltransferase involved in cell wall biosynthesis